MANYLLMSDYDVLAPKARETQGWGQKWESGLQVMQLLFMILL